MARRRLGSAVPEELHPTVDLEALKANMVRRANDQLPEDIRKLSPRECLARILEIGGVGQALRMRDPGDDDETIAA